MPVGEMSEEEITTRLEEIDQEVEELELEQDVRDFAYYVDEGFISIENINGEFFCWPEGESEYLEIPE